MRDFLTGLSDLPLCLAAGVFGFLAAKQKNKRLAVLFFLITVSAILGTLAHLYFYKPPAKIIVWTVLYPLLYESIRLFYVLYVNACKGTPVLKPYIIYIIESACCLTSLILLYCGSRYDIFMLALFGFICLLLIAASFIKLKKLPKSAALLIALCVLCAVMQMLGRFLMYNAVIEHALLLAALVIAYLSMKNKKA